MTEIRAVWMVEFRRRDVRGSKWKRSRERFDLKDGAETLATLIRTHYPKLEVQVTQLILKERKSEPQRNLLDEM